MAITKITIFIIAMTMALTIAITIRATTQVDLNRSVPEKIPEETIRLPSKRVRRFLANTIVNPRANAAIKCPKDNKMCNALMGDVYKCCKNKCMDLSEDKQNCGECKNHCKSTDTCCRGECVDVNYDKRHCGQCNNPCPGKYDCIYGTCNYA